VRRRFCVLVLNFPSAQTHHTRAHTPHDALILLLLLLAPPSEPHWAEAEAELDIGGLVAGWREAHAASVTAAFVPAGDRAIFVCARTRPAVFEIEAEAVADPPFITPCNPFVFVHTPAERLGVPTGEVCSTPHELDAAFAPSDDNATVYDVAVAPMIAHVVAGGNATVIAFGQTGSGKTFTQMAVQERAANELVQSLGADASLALRFYENHGDRFFDLLADRAEMPPLREDASGTVHVVASEVKVATVEAALEALRGGSAMRSSRATAGNPSSSRSHAICELIVPSSGGRLRVVDLAGSERREDVVDHSAEAMDETAKINWSLGCLKDCIIALRAREVQRMTGKGPNVHIKARACKLTLLLKEIFDDGNAVAAGAEEETGAPAAASDAGGAATKSSDASTSNSRLAFIACLAPQRSSLKHTKNTLNYVAALKTARDAASGFVASPEQLAQGVAAFFAKHNKPDLSEPTRVAGILAKFKGKEAAFHARLKKKYRDAPDVLLLAPGARDAAKKKSDPAKWSKKKLQGWLSKLDGGKFVAHLPAFEGISGTRMCCMDAKEVQRLCGVEASCAAFNDDRFAGVRTPEEEAAALAATKTPAEIEAEKVAKEAAQDVLREEGHRIYSAFAKARRAAKR